ncbi:MAG: VWA domain-containing protein [Clostridia bacterium]|nr:VWA domain-containing protein [Clostridia bacterium]
MSIINAKKEINLTEINCDDSLKVTLSLSAESDFPTNPADIVLLIDRACSLAGTPLSLLKESLYRFIDQIDALSNGSKCGTIGNGSRIGLVSFAGEAQINLPLSTSVETLKNEIATLTTGCNSNHSAAFSTAAGLFDSESQNRKFIVLFTASHNTIGTDPEIAANDMKEKGIMIYSIGVTGLGGLETERLKAWVSQPSETHAFLTDTLNDLNDLFSEVAGRIIGSQTTNIVIQEKINPDFAITDILTPNYGSVERQSDTGFIWSIPLLGTNELQETKLEFYIKHIAKTSGIKEISESTTYSDTEENTVLFPSPTVTVKKCNCLQTNTAPITLEVKAGSWREYLLYSTKEKANNNSIDINVIVQNLRPTRELRLRVTLLEIKNSCIEEERDIQRFVIYPNTRAYTFYNTNALIRNFHFNLPTTENQLKIRLSAQYID